MILLLRKWNGVYPTWEGTRSKVWFGDSSKSLTTWILSCSKMTWGYRSSKGYLGECSLVTTDFTYQWWAWTNEAFAREAYQNNKSLVDNEKAACYALTKELGLELIDIPAKMSLEKDPAGMTAEELDAIILSKQAIVTKGNEL